MHFESEFILNRKHLEECYDQSAVFTKKHTPRYKFIAALLITALLILFFGGTQSSLGYFFIGLTVLEFISFKYRRAWWLMRQVWSRNSGNTIKLIIDDNGIKTQSLYNNNQLLWSDINKINETSKGLMLTLNNGTLHYLSKATLNDMMIDFINNKEINKVNN